jgi:transposase-like protein
MNIAQVFKRFPNDKACIKFLESIRWKDGVVCPYCNSNKTCKHNVKNVNTRNATRHQCWTCKKSFSVTVNTIFHNTHIDLQKWFLAIALTGNAKKGISSYQLSRDLDIRQATAWSMQMRIRKAMQQDKGFLSGLAFEMDETYIKVDKNKQEKDDTDYFGGNMGRSTKDNTPVVGIKVKNGDIKAFATENTKYHTLGKIAMENVEIGSEIHTDEYSAYRLFNRFYKHKTVNHSKEYVSADDIHTNGVEGFWSLLKRGIQGNFHHISRKFLQNYVDEFCFKYNNRANNNVFDSIVKKMLVVC